ncbi:MAG: hypothetical protein IJL64_08070, partial [Bacteroidales bacterium]|nr:hypothetical protein [Bacteroidales bacterium]
GKTYTIAQIGPFKNDADDEIRLASWKAEGGWYRDNKAKLDELYDKLVELRHGMSQQLGFSDYVEMAYCRMTRNCYDRNDVEKFHEAVQKYIVPVADSIRRKQAWLGLHICMSIRSIRPSTGPRRYRRLLTRPLPTA